MNSAENSTNPAPSPVEAETLRQLEEVRRQIAESQRSLAGAAQGPVLLDIGLDADLLELFNAGGNQMLVLLIQVVRLLRSKPPASNGEA